MGIASNAFEMACFNPPSLRENSTIIMRARERGDTGVRYYIVIVIEQEPKLSKTSSSL